MSTEKFANNAKTTLNGAINNSVTSLVVTSATDFPTAGNFRILIDTELLLVTAVSGTTFTVTRGVEGTTAASHSDLAAVTHILTKDSLKNASGIREIYRVSATASDTNSPHSSTDVQINALSITFSLDDARDVLISCSFRATKSGGGARCRIYDSSTQISPVNETGLTGWHTITDADGGHQAVFWAIINLASGSHTINIKHQAIANTNDITFLDRFLTCEVLTDT